MGGLSMGGSNGGHGRIDPFGGQLTAATGNLVTGNLAF